MRQGVYNRRRCDVHALQGPNQTVGRIPTPRDLNEILVSVKRGSVDIWFGEFTGDRPEVPHLHFGQTNSPVWVPIPEGCYTITYRLEDLTSSNSILACVILGGP